MSSVFLVDREADISRVIKFDVFFVFTFNNRYRNYRSSFLCAGDGVWPTLIIIFSISF